jgi:hypothetical protein
LEGTVAGFRERLAKEKQAVTILFVAALVGYTLTVYAVSARIPGEPFPDLRVDRLRWPINLVELAYVLLVALATYLVCYWATSRLDRCGKVLWAICLGAYLALIVHFDVLSKVENLPFPGFLDNTAGALLSLVGLFAVLPAAAALVFRAAGRLVGACWSREL